MNKQIDGANLLAMRSLATQAKDSAVTTLGNMDALIRHYVVLQTENIKLRAELADMNAEKVLERAEAIIVVQEQEIAAQQARIDSLMLEHCPNEMTPEQIAEWGRNQRPATSEEQAALDAAMPALLQNWKEK